MGRINVNESMTTSQKRDMAVSPMDSIENMDRKVHEATVMDENSSGPSGIRVRDEGPVSVSHINSSSLDRESPLEIRFNKGLYANNPSTITLG